jgi:hypothetical protein
MLGVARKIVKDVEVNGGKILKKKKRKKKKEKKAHASLEVDQTSYHQILVSRNFRS